MIILPTQARALIPLDSPVVPLPTQAQAERMIREKGLAAFNAFIPQRNEAIKRSHEDPYSHREI